ncbi:hypothetical protein C8J57DRAFT_1459549 [Mycena rebaudengoi]|nr:hypothetical protein C8J57DRAFT_1459549 [Mycena rebaudengoi]
MLISPATLPNELCDFIIDHLHADRPTLAVCALVCRSWAPASRFHLLPSISLSDKTGRRAARLNALLASPHQTLTPAVRALSLLNALAPLQVRLNGKQAYLVTTLLSLVPRITQLRHIHTLALSDLPYPLLHAIGGNVKHLSLTGITAGPAISSHLSALPRLTHLTLHAVAAIPFRAGAPAHQYRDTHNGILQKLEVSASPLAFLGWLPPARALILHDALAPHDFLDIAAYLTLRGAAVQHLEFGVVGDSGLDESILPSLVDLCPNLQSACVVFWDARAASRFFAFPGTGIPIPTHFDATKRVRVGVRIQIQNEDEDAKSGATFLQTQRCDLDVHVVPL